LDPSVGTYVDGVYWARAYGLSSTLVDVDNFQALKGPQGTLFGRNTSGGAILVNTKDPSFREGLSGSLSGSYGNYNYQALTAIFNAPLVSDKLAARVVFSGNKRDGYSRNLNTGTMLNNLNDFLIRAKVLVKPMDNLRLIFSAETYHENILEDSGRLGFFVPNGFPSFEGGLERLGAAACLADQPACVAVGNGILAKDQALSGDAYHTDLGTDPRIRTDTQTFSLAATYDAGFGTIKGIGAYRHIH
jgi:iron complex outermembrane receptor protein